MIALAVKHLDPDIGYDITKGKGWRPDMIISGSLILSYRHKIKLIKKTTCLGRINKGKIAFYYALLTSWCNLFIEVKFALHNPVRLGNIDLEIVRTFEE